MTTLERFLEYIKIPTQSAESTGICPTTDKQFALAHRLVHELQELGIADAYADEHCYVYAHIPATPGYENVTRVGLIAHLDTAPDFADEPVNVQILRNYDGGNVALGTSGRTLTVDSFPHLPSLKGRTLITTDGMTLLGADDKAGIAEILTAAEHILTRNIPHGPISIGFTPDEEVGTSADGFDLAKFDAEYAYTVDGGPEGEVVYETFNAAAADFEVKGFNIHPGSSKNRMINASLVAMEINAMLPTGEIPRCTEGYEGFYHLCDMAGSVESAELHYIVRDHSASKFAARIETLRHIEKLMNEKYGAGTVTLSVREQYRNMAEIIEQHPAVLEIADRAIELCGFPVVHSPIRGGTDGAHLSFMGLPTPNLGTGGYAAHGPYEHVTEEGLEMSTKVIETILRLWAEKGAK